MKSISIFNNKGGVGKTTLTFHLGHALAEMGYRTLLIDLDPQCNLTIFGMDEETIHNIWRSEDDFIDDFQAAREKHSSEDLTKLIRSTRSAHFIAKPAQDGAAEMEELPPPFSLAENLDLIPGRLTMHLYEDKVASRWSDVYQGDPLAIRTVTRFRNLAKDYSELNKYEIVIMDTSPSLGALNKIIISTTDGFLIPCMPDMFSLYGVRNIGNALNVWNKQFDTIHQLLSVEKRKSFPENYVQLLGYTIYNAKKYSGSKPWNLATAQYNYAKQIPDEITHSINRDLRKNLTDPDLQNPVGGEAIMHAHNTLPNMAQRYHLPMWKVPACNDLEQEDTATIKGNRKIYENTQEKYHEFANALLSRLKMMA